MSTSYPTPAASPNLGTFASSTSPLNPPAPPLPDATDPEIQKLAWLREKLDEGRAFLAAQPNYDRITRSIEVIMGTDDQKAYDVRSTVSFTRTNRVGKIFSDLTAQLTDIKPFWEYSTFNRKFEQHASNYSKLATSWYQRRDCDVVWGEIVQFDQVAGAGYFHLVWDSELQDITCHSENPQNVIPIDPKSNRSLEDCMGVIVCRKVPTSYIRTRYKRNVPSDEEGSVANWLKRGIETLGDIASPLLKWGKSNRVAQAPPRIPCTTLYTAYVKDYRHNNEEDLGVDFDGSPIEIGEFMDGPDGKRIPANNWSYLVGVGEPLYPRRRMILWAGDVCLYDGPNMFWHGQFPITKFTLDPVPWSWFGRTSIGQLLTLQVSLNKLLRNVDDHINQVAQPGSVHDKNNVSPSTYNSFNTREAGWKIRQNPIAGKGIQIINPPPLDSSVMEHRDWICNEMEKLAGTVDISQLMSLAQLPSNSTVESIINGLTPTNRRRSRLMEAFQRQVAMQLAFNFTQFYTLPMRLSILGPDGITQDDFDFDPGTIIPDFMDSDYNEQGEISAEAFARGPLPRYDRTREWMRQLVFKITPGSLLNSAQLDITLMYFQLFRAGVIDPITLMEKMNIPNIGVEKIPPQVRTILERLAWCQMVGLVPNISAAGRKASGQEPPEIKVSESG